jgi:hypothetical protein
MAKTYGPTGEGVKPTLGVAATMGDSIASPGAASKVPGSPTTDIPAFAAPGGPGGEKRVGSAGAAPDFASPGGAQGYSHGKK